MDKQNSRNGVTYYRTSEKAVRDFQIGIWYDGETKEDADWIMAFVREEPGESHAKGKFSSIPLEN